ncbi:MAG: hypothetical protein DMF81_14255 [Acidobacteria bacterium]|nr:MAG: hypothetical protein DMF81_14255 [Acidobacteriota bacterium]
MSKIREFVSKGVRLIVTDTDAGERAETAQEKEIPPEAFEAPPPRAARSGLPASVEDFAAVYQEAGIQLPPHGYGVDKVAEMLESKRLAPLGREVKATAVLAALEAAHVGVRDVIQDAVRRDGALDAFEAAKEREVQELRERSEARVKTIKEEIERFLRDKNAEIESLKQASEAASQAFTQLQARKRREEERLYEVVAHFVEAADNPITTASSPRGAAAPAKPARE